MELPAAADNVRVPPFALDPPLRSAGSAWTRAALGLAIPALERTLGLTALGRMYDDAVGSALVDDFPERALTSLGITWRTHGLPLQDVPAEGPLVVVANHPFGAADGLILLALMRQVRRNARLLGNYLLQRIPEMQHVIIAVDPFGGLHAQTMNREMLRRATDWAKRGGAVIVFPAGEVSHRRAPGDRLVDDAWKAGALKVAEDAGATVLPVFFEGRNSRTFEWAGHVHPRLRTALLPRELLRMRGATIGLAIGTPISPARLAALPDRGARMAYLRAATFAAAHAIPRITTARATPAPAPVVLEGAREALEAEVAALPHDRRLIRHHEYDVLYTTAQESPAVLQEIGRLRERTFRAVGEGTGRATDLDRFDAHYWHLVLWHRTRQEIAGAYRIGTTDTILRQHGARGLYTRTLFRYGRAFLHRIGPALELGRSFVRPEYQREHGALFLLWQGIGQFVARHPRYRRLFGAVSISANYTDSSTDLLIDALARLRPTGTPLVLPRRPYVPRTGTPTSALTTDLRRLHRVIADLEPDGKGLPVLVRQYLKLNARVYATSVDPQFSNAIDALMVVDLDEAGGRVVGRCLST